MGFLLLSVRFSGGQIGQMNHEAFEARMKSRFRSQKSGHFEQLLPANALVPAGREKLHLEVLISRLFLGPYEPLTG